MTSCRNRNGALDRSFSDNLGFWNRPPSCSAGTARVIQQHSIVLSSGGTRVLVSIGMHKRVRSQTLGDQTCKWLHVKKACRQVWDPSTYVHGRFIPLRRRARLQPPTPVSYTPQWRQFLLRICTGVLSQGFRSGGSAVRSAWPPVLFLVHAATSAAVACRDVFLRIARSSLSIIGS